MSGMPDNHSQEPRGMDSCHGSQGELSDRGGQMGRGGSDKSSLPSQAADVVGQDSMETGDGKSYGADGPTDRY